MKFDVLTIFPNLFDSFKKESLISKALKNKIISINIIDIRNFTSDKHKTVDDTPYGGGAGMLMKIEPIYKALKSLKKEKDRRIILLSPGGEQFTQKKAVEYSKFKNLVFICGRYEGIDARIENFIDEKISIGPYVLNGGEVASMVVMESVSRLLPNFLGNKDSLNEETFNEKENADFVEYPQFTRPEIFKVGNKQYKVPEVLLSGNHKLIEEWKKKNSK